MRVTKQREAVLRALREMHSHPTAEEVHGVVRESLPHVSLGTVYRILASLVSEGQAVALTLMDGPRRYDLPGPAHHHVVCKQCGAIADVPDVVAYDAHRAAEEATGYAVEAVRLKWLGTCPRCLAARTLSVRSDPTAPTP